MFNLGVDGDEALAEQHAVSRQLQQYQDRIMLQEDAAAAAAAAAAAGGEPSPRGEEHTPFIALLTQNLLRISFSIKALSVALISLFFLGFGGRWVFTFHSHPDMTNGFHLSVALLMLLQLMGTIGLALFQAFVADDSK
ncbi:Chromosome III, complete sequence, related [Eimeria brunetti]|uniref:Chromosome III, complete sequence, related n=1 Tax=Eimeria brunetti TaxID=51314 RepID=U6LTK4_9EIME|nr:Chromosome III, complete sequence, related [Eimeria brunetti]